jgi:hypothetical protein
LIGISLGARIREGDWGKNLEWEKIKGSFDGENYKSLWEIMLRN